MNCYHHPEVESVVNCGKCGIAMCRDCETNAFFRTDNGTGQALCNRCSLVEAQNIVGFESSWLKKRLIKLIFCSVFVGLGLLSLLSENYGIPSLIICWLISGLIANIGVKKQEGSVKSQVWSAAYDYNHPIMSLIINIVVYTIFAPIMLISNLIGYIKTKSSYKKNLENLNTIKNSI